LGLTTACPSNPTDVEENKNDQKISGEPVDGIRIAWDYSIPTEMTPASQISYFYKRTGRQRFAA
jgi:hypothetical protein